MDWRKLQEWVRLRMSALPAQPGRAPAVGVTPQSLLGGSTEWHVGPG